MSFAENISSRGAVYMTSGLISAVHCFTTRTGGVSRGIYSSLNLGENSGDDHDDIRENYLIIKKALGLKNIVFTGQVHGSGIHAVTADDAHELFEPLPFQGDALITDRNDCALIIFTADCIPILLHDPVRGAVGAVHAGWRGTVADIAGKTVRKMCSEYGCSPENIKAAIGPGIGRCCYETGTDVREAVIKVLESVNISLPLSDFISPSGAEGKFMTDLKAVNRVLLTAAGVPSENIDVSDECTMCLHEKYWSHRYTGGKRGSQASIIMMRGD